MSELAWWMLSPSPFSILFYLLLTFYGMRKLMAKVQYKRKVLGSFTDGLFLVGFIVLITDTIWVVMSGLRFGSLYPRSVPQLVLSAGRNLVGLLLCYLLVGGYFKQGVCKLTKHTAQLILVNTVFIVVWFLLAPSPAYTDWTFAIRHDYPLLTVLSSFLISHIIGKTLVAATYLTIWRKT